MKAISQGNNVYDIFDDSLKVYDQLPAQAYVVRFSERKGFFLEKYADIEITETKVYGVHNAKIQKVMTAFKEMPRNLGVILSGDKGIGKSLFAKMLSKEAINNQIPVIIVDTYVNGIASYIESIEQEVMVLFDEFDKTFGEVRAKDGESSPQSNLLTLFDGISAGKKMFVITCNELRSLNSYLINRPGRFHYHFRFEYPSAAEIKLYLKDKVKSEFHNEIDNVVAFAAKVNLNYDCLRSIAFELNHGLTFSEAISDLNIINMNAESYRVILRYENGLTVSSDSVRLDMFAGESTTTYMYNNGYNLVDVTFNTEDAAFDMHSNCYMIPADKLKLSYFDYDKDNEKEKEIYESAKSSNVECLMIRRMMSKQLHYTV